MRVASLSWRRSWHFEFAVNAAAFLLALRRRPLRPRRRLPLVSHRAAYELSLADPTAPPRASVQTPIAASGLIAYEFRGSACEGYTSNFRQMTEMERSEGDPLSMDINALSFEDGGRQSDAIPDRHAGRHGSPRRSRGPRPAARTTTCKVELTKPTAEDDRLRPGRSVSDPACRADDRGRQEGRRHDGGARLRRLRHRREDVRHADRRRQGGDAGRATTPTPRSSCKESAAGRLSSPISTKPPRMRRRNISSPSISMRTASRAR